MMGKIKSYARTVEVRAGSERIAGNFREEMATEGTRWLFVCSKSGHRTAAADSWRKLWDSVKIVAAMKILGGGKFQPVKFEEDETQQKNITKIDTVVAYMAAQIPPESDCFHTASISSSFRRPPPPMCCVPVLSVIHNDDQQFDKYSFTRTT